jgi:hypothetical protein
MSYDDADADAIAAALVDQLATACDYLPVPDDGARRAATMLTELL